MGAATYERKKDGIFCVGRRVFTREALGPAACEIKLEGTPWTLLHRQMMGMAGERTYYSQGEEVQLLNTSRGTVGFHVLASEIMTTIRFATLSAPTLRILANRIQLEECDLAVAELIPAWRDADAEAGILARVETSLPSPAGDAAALLLFRLQHLHAVAPAPEAERPLGF